MKQSPGPNYLSDFPYTIMQVVPRLGAGGAERTTLEIAGAVVEAGGRALVVSAGGRLGDDIMRAGGELIIAPVHRRDPVSIIANAGLITRLMRDEGVDLIHGRSRAPAWSAGMAARRVGAPFVTTFHGAHNAHNPIKRWYNSALVRGDIVIANSRFTGDRVAADYKLTPQRLRVIPRGADLRVFDPGAVTAAQCAAMKAAWGIVPDDRAATFLAPGRLTPWKGQNVAIAAASILKAQVNAGNAPALRVILCGGARDDSDYENVLRAEIEQRGVRDMVRLVGEITDMATAYACADAVIAPSLRPEPFGRVAAEAGAMGKAVIAADHGGFRETLVDGETGLLTEPGSAEALSAAMGRLAGDADLRARLGDAASARVRAVYSSAAMCDATLNVYRELLGRGA